MSTFADQKKKRILQIKKFRAENPDMEFDLDPEAQATEELNYALSQVTAAESTPDPKSQIRNKITFPSPKKLGVQESQAGAGVSSGPDMFQAADQFSFPKPATPLDGKAGAFYGGTKKESVNVATKSENPTQKAASHGNMLHMNGGQADEEEAWEYLGEDGERIAEAEKELDASVRKSILDAVGKVDLTVLPEKSTQFDVFLSHTFEHIFNMLSSIRVLILDNEVLAAVVDAWMMLFLDFRTCNVSSASKFVSMVISRSYVFTALDGKIKSALEKAVFSYSRLLSVNQEYTNLKGQSSGTVFLALIRRSMSPSVASSEARAIDRLVNRGAQNLFPVHISQIVGHAEGFLSDYSQQSQISSSFATQEYLDSMNTLFPSSRFSYLGNVLLSYQNRLAAGDFFTLDQLVDDVRDAVGKHRTHTRVLFESSAGNASVEYVTDSRPFSRQLFKAKKQQAASDVSAAQNFGGSENAKDRGKKGKGKDAGKKAGFGKDWQNFQGKDKKGGKGKGKGKEKNQGNFGNFGMQLPKGYCFDYLVYGDCRNENCEFAHEQPKRGTGQAAAAAATVAKGSQQQATSAEVHFLNIFNDSDQNMVQNFDIFEDSDFSPSAEFSFFMNQAKWSKTAPEKERWLKKATENIFKRITCGDSGSRAYGSAEPLGGEQNALIDAAKEAVSAEFANSSSGLMKENSFSQKTKYDLLVYENSIQTKFEPLEFDASFNLPKSENEKWHELKKSKNVKKKPGAKSKSLKEVSGNVEISEEGATPEIPGGLKIPEILGNSPIQNLSKFSDEKRLQAKLSRARRHFMERLKEWTAKGRKFLVDSGANLSNIIDFFDSDQIIREFDANIKTVGGMIAVSEGARIEISPGVFLEATRNPHGPNLLALVHVCAGTGWQFSCRPCAVSLSGVRYFFRSELGIEVELRQENGLPFITGDDIRRLEGLHDAGTLQSQVNTSILNDAEKIVDEIFQLPSRSLMNKSKMSKERKTKNDEHFTRLSEDAKKLIKTSTSLEDFLAKINNLQGDIIPDNGYDIAAKIKHRHHGKNKMNKIKIFDLAERLKKNPKFLSDVSTDTGFLKFESYLNRSSFTIVRDETSGEIFADSRDSMDGEETVRVFKNMFDKDFTSKIFRVHSDNGTEYTNDKFRDFCSENFISHSTSNDTCHSENGHVENEIQILKSDIHANIMKSGLPYAMWENAMIYSVHQRNSKKLPEIYKSCEFQFGQFVIFRSSHVLSDAQKNGTPRGRVGVFLNYSTECLKSLKYKSYLVLDLFSLRDGVCRFFRTDRAVDAGVPLEKSRDFLRQLFFDLDFGKSFKNSEKKSCEKNRKIINKTLTKKGGTKTKGVKFADEEEMVDLRSNKFSVKDFDDDALMNRDTFLDDSNFSSPDDIDLQIERSKYESSKTSKSSPIQKDDLIDHEFYNDPPIRAIEFFDIADDSSDSGVSYDSELLELGELVPKQVEELAPKQEAERVKSLIQEIDSRSAGAQPPLPVAPSAAVDAVRPSEFPHRGIQQSEYRTTYQNSIQNQLADSGFFDLHDFLFSQASNYCSSFGFQQDSYTNFSSEDRVFNPMSIAQSSETDVEFNNRVYENFMSLELKMQHEHQILTRNDPLLKSTEMLNAQRAEWENFKNFEVFGKFVHKSQVYEKILYPVVVNSIKFPNNLKLRKAKCRIAIDGSRMNKTFSDPVIPLTHEIRRILSYIALKKGLSIGTADARSGYLQATLPQEHERVFMNVPSFVEGWFPGAVCEVFKAVYGLPDAGRIFQRHTSRVLKKIGFVELPHFPGVFKRIKGTQEEYVGVYVDDLFLCATDIQLLAQEITSNGLILGDTEVFQNGEPIKYNGIDIQFSHKYMSENMSDSISKLLNTYTKMIDKTHLRQFSTPGMSDFSEFTEKSDMLKLDSYDPHSVVASLLYISRLSRPDLAHSVSFLTRQINQWSKGADKALLKLMGYLSGTTYLSLHFEIPPKSVDSPDCDHFESLLFYSDADLGGDITTSRSCGGDCTFLTFLRHDGTEARWLIGWSSKLLTQKSGATATTELAAHQRGLEARAMPISLFLEDLTGFEVPIRGNLDNAAAVSAIRHGYSAALRHLARHSRLSLTHLNSFYLAGANQLSYVKTGDNIADIYTKALSENLHWQFVTALHMWNSRLS